MENTNVFLKKKAALYGLALGGLLLFFAILSLYLLAYTSALSLIITTPILISFVLPILLSAYFMVCLRKKMGGYWSFRQATSAAFIMFFCAYLVATAGNLGFLKWVDTGVLKKTQVNMLRITTNSMKERHLSDSIIQQQTHEIQKSFGNQEDVNFSMLTKNISFSIIIFFAFALIYGALFKRQAVKG